jgi:hypothetical protein
MNTLRLFAVILTAALCGITVGCHRQNTDSTTNKSVSQTAKTNTAPVLRGASSYTPYDWPAMLWAKNEIGSMVWVSSGGEAGKLLASQADPARRPDWILCSQGVVAGLAARGEKPVIIGTVFVSSNAILPVFRKPRAGLAGSRSLFIPRSSIELAFDRLLRREGVPLEQVRLPKVESPSFNTIVSLLQKPSADESAIDFGILVEPFITNLIGSAPDNYEVGEGGLYELCYCIVVRREDIQKSRAAFVTLLRQFDSLSTQVEKMESDDVFFAEVWGRKKGTDPDRLSRLLTFERRPARLALDAAHVRGLLREEISYLVGKYPQDLRLPDNVEGLVDESVLREANPARLQP